MDLQVPPEIKALCEALLQGLQAALGEKLFGVYLYGAMAFPDAWPVGDIDFHVILSSTLSDEEKASLTRLHAALARDFPPLGDGLDGYYILLEAARQTSPPAHQFLADVVDEAWALHRAHIRAGRCIILKGPDPKDIYPPASWPELEDALRGELAFVEEHLDDYPAYCVLNLCRLIVSFSTREVVISKMASAEWAWTSFPEWRGLIDAARQSYRHQAAPEGERLLKDTVGSFLAFAREQIEPHVSKPL